MSKSYVNSPNSTAVSQIEAWAKECRALAMAISRTGRGRGVEGMALLCPVDIAFIMFIMDQSEHPEHCEICLKGLVVFHPACWRPMGFALCFL